jgi:beta-lactamase class A
MTRLVAVFVAVWTLSLAVPAVAFVPPPVSALSSQLRTFARRQPGRIAFDVVDLTSGYSAGYEAGLSMPAASTIKIPVMVEVFRQLEAGRFDLNRRLTLLASDKDWGSGELCDAPSGSTYSISTLLGKMIDISDNTATNMLIRFIGRQNINHTMYSLGLRHTQLTTDIRTEGYAIRNELRSSPGDMALLLARMARQRLIDRWSSREMIAILKGQEYNSLIPAVLPADIPIAHKTGTLHDTLNDVGIVYDQRAPYVIAVMTTDLPSLDDGESAIRGISRLAYRQMNALASWRTAVGLDLRFEPGMPEMPPPSSQAGYWLGAGIN